MLSYSCLIYDINYIQIIYSNIKQKIQTVQNRHISDNLDNNR